MKGRSEGKVREALNQTELPGLIVYKPPDDARNWKPCDYMAWWAEFEHNHPPTGTPPYAAWIEVKECDNIGSFPLAELRPAQRRAIVEATAIGLPYYLIVWWPKRKIWTISDAGQLHPMPARGAIAFSILAGKIGIDAQPAQLGSVLAAVLRGEVL